MMLNLSNISIKRKLLMIVILTVGVALSTMSLSLFTYQWIALRKAMVSRLSSIAQIVGTNCTGGLFFNDHKIVTKILTALESESDIKVAVIFDRNGSSFAQYVRLGYKISQPVKAKSSS